MRKIIIENLPIVIRKNIKAKFIDDNKSIVLIDVDILVTPENYEIIESGEKCLIIAVCNHQYKENNLTCKQAYYIGKSNNIYWIITTNEKDNSLNLLSNGTI